MAIRIKQRTSRMSPGFRLLIPALLLFATQTAFAGGGGGQAIVIVADSRGLTGLMAWWANLYNESHLQFTLLTIVLIPLIGCVLGLLADAAMRCIGIDLKSRELAEH